MVLRAPTQLLLIAALWIAGAAHLAEGEAPSEFPASGQLLSVLDLFGHLERQRLAPIELQAERATWEPDKLTLEGDVVVSWGGLTIHADRFTRDDAAWSLERARVDATDWCQSRSEQAKTPATTILCDSDLQLSFTRASLDPHAEALILEGLSISATLPCDDPDAPRVSHAAEIARVELPSKDPEAATLSGVTLRPCACDSGGGLALSIERVQLQREGGLALDGTELHWGSWSLPLMVDHVESDLRASGFLLPTIGYSEALGVIVTLPVFIRMGPSADLTITPGWATSLGPQLGLGLRYHSARQTRGELWVEARYVLDPSTTQLQSQGHGRAALWSDLHLMYEVDLLSDVTYHPQLARALAERSARSRRSLLSLAWEGTRWSLSTSGALFQASPRPTQAAALGFTGDRFAPWPAEIPAAHQLPRVDLELFSRRFGPLRFDLAANYLHTHPLAAPNHLDWGSDPSRSLLGLDPSFDSGRGDGLRDVAGEPLARAHHVGVDGSLTWPIDLAGYATSTLGVLVRQRHLIARGEDNALGASNTTTFVAAAQLETSLARRYDDALHVIEPSLSWRGVVAQGADIDERSGWLDAQAEPIAHSVVAGAAQRWLAERWQLNLSLDGALFFDDDCESSLCGAIFLDASWRRGLWTLEALGGWDWSTPEDFTSSARLRLGDDLGWRGGLGHHRLATKGFSSLWEPARGWFAAPRLKPTPWRAARDASVSTASLGWRSPRWEVEGLGAIVWDEALDGEAQLTTFYNAECGCWRLGASVARRASTPRWDSLLLFSWSTDAMPR